MKINKLNILFISANNKIRNDGKVPDQVQKLWDFSIMQKLLLV